MTAMAKHSPGPWQIRTHEYRDFKGCECREREAGPIRICCDLPRGTTEGDQAEADLAVASKSPAMLAMLVRVLETCHMSEDESLRADLSRLVAEARGEAYVEPGDEDGEDGE